jgi:sugar phosphate isomerase/epimerase
VRKLLAENRYNGWMSIEEGSASDEEYRKILDQIIAL